MSAHCAAETSPPSTEAIAANVDVLLVGRPNVGKSSLFNALTGKSAHVGNFPGITVDVLEGELALPSGKTARVLDLPGLYSIKSVVTPGTDEAIAKDFLEHGGKDASARLVVHVIDATHLALGLRLGRELARQPQRRLVLLTQRDVLEAEGRAIDVEALAEILGDPVVLISAKDHDAKARVGAAIDDALARPARVDAADWNPDEVAERVWQASDSAPQSASRRRTFTARADAILLHSFVGPLLFLGIIGSLFASVFVVADPASALLDSIISAFRGRLALWFGDGKLVSFLSDGILAGAGTVLAFMPQIVILTVALEILEASGYLARGAFLMDRLLRILGLSGRAFVPLLMGHACAIPAISATRIIRDPRERLTTILVLPLMTCSARIPTYALLISTFFASRGAWFKAFLFVGLYFAGIVSALAASLVLRKTATKGRALPLILEMPSYRNPSWRAVAKKGWLAAKRFTREVGTFVVIASAVLWIFLKVPAPGGHDAQVPNPPAGTEVSQTMPVEPPIDFSIGARVGKALEPITMPLGFDWRINVGLIGSFGAREVMVGTLGVIFGLDDGGDDTATLSQKLRGATNAEGRPAYSMATALALLAFFVVACQCMSTVAAIRRETKSLRWPIFVLVYTYSLGYALAFVVYRVSAWFGLA